MRRLSSLFQAILPGTIFVLFPTLLMPLATAQTGPPTAVQEQIEQAAEAEENAHAQRMQGDIEAARALDFEARELRLEAVDLLQEASIEYQAPGDYFEALLEVLDALGYHDLAAEHLEKALAHQPESPALWLRLGQHRANMGPAGLETAFDALMQARSLASEEDDVFADIEYALAHVYYRQGLYAFAREHVETAVSQAEDHLEAQVLLAALDARDGEIRQASERLEELGRAIQPLDAETRILLRESLAHFDKTRGRFPDTAAHHFAYARLLYRAARIHEAVLALQRCTTLEPEDIEVWNFLAAIHLQIGNYPAGRDAYEQSLEVDPEQPQIRQSLDELTAFMEEMEAQQAEQQSQPQPTPPQNAAPTGGNEAPIPLR